MNSIERVAITVIGVWVALMYIAVVIIIIGEALS
jgi:hypothetical protein